MLKMKRYTSIDQVPVSIWDSFSDRNAVGLESAHLRAVEESGINDIQPYYLIGFRDDQPVGIGYCFSIQVDLAAMSGEYPEEVLKAVKTWNPDFMNVRVVEVGHLASIGCSFTFFPEEEQAFLTAFSKEVDEIAERESTDLIIIRDMEESHSSAVKIFEKERFQPVTGFPVARMNLEWTSFEGYLHSLKSKKRHNIRQKRKKLNAPGISVEVIEDYAPYADRLAELWTNVARRNDGYDHEQLTPAYFRSMAERLKGRSHVTAIKLYGQIVAYGLNLIGDREYFGVAEGLDYSIRDQYDLYANNIFEGLKTACELGKSVFNIGVTTYDFKTSIGADLDSCVYMVKACKEPRFSAVYADLLSRSIVQPRTVHRAFRSENPDPETGSVEERKSLPEKESKTESRDIFSKHLSYLRIDTGRSAGLYTYCPEFESAQEPVVRHSGRDVIMLGTNSYLGLSTHPEVKAAIHRAVDHYGSGCSGSPLLNGTLDLHRRLSCRLAEFTGKEDALVFSTGYQTNLGVISAIAGRHDVLIMDKRNHASLVDGARLSGAAVARYKHNDMDSLERALRRFADKPKLVITDSLFSMEGTIVNLPEVLRLTKKYDARLMLDESHGLGVFGQGGRGVAEHYGLLDQVDLIMGTFSKSLASVGGFVAGDWKVIDTLKHTARSHIFSASLPPSAAAAVLAALDLVENEPERRDALLANAAFLADGLESMGFQVGNRGSAIIPVHCGHELLALGAFRELFDRGVFVNPVTYPAVPVGQEMLRLSVMATHNRDMLSRALAVFQKIRTPFWPTSAIRPDLLSRKAQN